MMIAVVSGLLAVVIFFMIITASAGSRGGAASVTVQASPGQPVDSYQAYGAPETTTTLAPGPTVAPVQQPQQAAANGGQAVEAPPASAPPNPFTSGIH